MQTHHTPYVSSLDTQKVTPSKTLSKALWQAGSISRHRHMQSLSQWLA